MAATTEAFSRVKIDALLEDAGWNLTDGAADETYVLKSRKGERQLDRKARRRGGKAVERGVSREQVPVPAAADRGGATVSAALPAVSAAALEGALEPVVETDVALASDGAAGYPPCAVALGVRREALNVAAGEQVRDAFHIQTVNSRHGRLKGFLRGFRGVATKYLDSYLRRLHLIGLADPASPRARLSAAMSNPSIRFAD